MAGWGVVYTAPREELRAQEHLERQSFEVFLPLMRKRGRSAEDVEPLFSRYMFVKIGRWWSPILGTRGVVCLIMEGDEPAYVRPRIIRELQARADDDGVLELEPFKIGAGVRVKAGGKRALGGFEGLYAGMTRRDRCAVLMTMLGRETRVEVRLDDIELA